jgi:hypothetical protein
MVFIIEIATQQAPNDKGNIEDRNDCGKVGEVFGDRRCHRLRHAVQRPYRLFNLLHFPKRAQHKVEHFGGVASVSIKNVQSMNVQQLLRDTRSQRSNAFVNVARLLGHAHGSMSLGDQMPRQALLARATIPSSLLPERAQLGGRVVETTRRIADVPTR